MKQLDLFAECGETIDTRKEFIMFKKFAIVRKLGWQDFVAKELVRLGDYNFDINKLIPEFMEELDLVSLGYTVIVPDEKLYRDRIEPKLKFKFSISTARNQNRIELDIKF